MTDKDKKTTTGIGNVDRKMEMLTSLLENTLKAYHNPVSFLAQVDALIQALRNFTWSIQANKANIENFEAWYSPWQQRMKNQSYLRWLNDTRVDIVHKDTLTTKSRATLELNSDYLQKFTTKYFDVMMSTEEIIEKEKESADETPILKHSTGRITREYYVEIEGKEVNVLSVLRGVYAFMYVLHEDLAAHLQGREIIQKELPDLSDGPPFPEDMLAVTYKLRDGAILTENNVEVGRKKLLEGGKLARKRYGTPNMKNRLNSEDKQEVARAYFELASMIFRKDGHHIPMLHMLRDDNSGFMIQPNYHDRAEKIHFFRKLADTVKDNEVDRIVFITESWHLFDYKRVNKQLSSGKELSALRKKGEGLDVLFLDKTGFIALLSAPILRDKDDKKAPPKLGELHETQFKPEEYPAFAGVFYAWGLVEKITVEKTFNQD
jgi:hypothetical protein